MNNDSQLKSHQNAFTLVELLISMIVASILMLTIGVLSVIASSSFTRLNREQAIYNDIAYGIKLMQHRIRSAVGITPQSVGNPWLGRQIEVQYIDNNGALQTTLFGVCQVATGSQLVHRPNAATACADADVILSAAAATGDSVNLTLNWPCACHNSLTHECIDDCLDDCDFDNTGSDCDCSNIATKNPVADSGTCALPTDLINAEVTGTKNDIPFEVITTILRRNT
ncbi:MAG TPA: prepilin-type N-terminal cleavage/methylation domain-containing protein [Candidatus Entotheonella sp.]